MLPSRQRGQRWRRMQAAVDGVEAVPMVIIRCDQPETEVVASSITHFRAG